MNDELERMCEKAVCATSKVLAMEGLRNIMKIFSQNSQFHPNVRQTTYHCSILLIN